MEVPVYLFAGFLDSGKTSFIRDTLTGDFTEDCRTLLLVCEEGMEEYDPAVLAAHNVVMEVIESEEDLNVFHLNALERKYRPDQIIMEFNGMWSMAKFEQENKPNNWAIYQLVVTVDSTTFDLYVKNMGAIMMEKLMAADMIIFNRCTDELAAALRKRNLKMVNRRAEIFLSYTDGSDDEYDDGTLCPFDLSRDTLEIGDDEFGFFYVDVLEKPDLYDGKRVTYLGRVAKDKRFPRGSFVAGRHAMVCCEEDITFLGLICMGPAYLDQVRTRDWVRVTARIAVEDIDLYEGKGPMLYVEKLEHCDPPAPDQELVMF